LILEIHISPITLHGASLYFGINAASPLRAALAALTGFTARRHTINEQLLERAARYEATQPSYADDLRACASAGH
jgi:hypothetical protein